MPDQQELMQKEELAVHEWLAVVFFAAFMAFLTYISSLNSAPLSLEQAPLDVKSKNVRVHVSGAVSLPGSYTLDSTSTLKDVLNLAKPCAKSDLSRLKLKSKLCPEQQIVIKEKPTIEIKVFGAVLCEGAFSLPKGTCLNELFKYVPLSADADLDLLEKKRRLRQGETVHVKSVNKNF